MRIEADANVQLPFDAKFDRDFDARVGVITFAYATRINFECFENLRNDFLKKSSHITSPRIL